MVLSRQPMPTLDRTRYASAEGVRRGGYILADNGGAGGRPEVILTGAGTDVSLCVEAYERLAAEGARVVSLPSWVIFEHQDEDCKNEVLPPSVPARVAVEQAGTFGWRRYVNSNEAIVGMKTFGASAPLKELTRKFGFTVENVVDTARREMGKYKS